MMTDPYRVKIIVSIAWIVIEGCYVSGLFIPMTVEVVRHHRYPIEIIVEDRYFVSSVDYHFARGNGR